LRLHVAALGLAGIEALAQILISPLQQSGFLL
jgi:hypothetical protein